MRATEPEVRGWINHIMDGTEGRVTSPSRVEAERKKGVFIDVSRVPPPRPVAWSPLREGRPTNRPMSTEGRAKEGARSG